MRPLALPVLPQPFWLLMYNRGRISFLLPHPLGQRTDGGGEYAALAGILLCAFVYAADRFLVCAPHLILEQCGAAYSHAQ